MDVGVCRTALATLGMLLIFINSEFVLYIHLDYNMKGTLGFFLASVSTAFDTVYCFILLLPRRTS